MNVHFYMAEPHQAGGQAGRKWCFAVVSAKPHIELKKKKTHHRPHLCRHLDVIGFSRAGKSNVFFVQDQLLSIGWALPFSDVQ